MPIRPFRRQDAGALAALSGHCLKSEADFVLNPLWESEGELFAEFERFGIDPEGHVLVAESADGRPLGLAGFLRWPGAREAGLLAPVVERADRGRGLGGELLRAALALGRERLGIRLVTGALGTRNRSGYALLTGLGFQPVRQHFLMRCEERPGTVHLPVEGLSLDVAKIEEAEAIGDLYAASGFEARSAERMEALMSDGRHFHAVARHGDRIVAFTELECHWPRRVWVAFVGVSSDLRNRGVGTALVAWALQRQFDERAENALLLLSPANRPAVRAYEKVGFRHHRTVDVLQRVP